MRKHSTRVRRTPAGLFSLWACCDHRWPTCPGGRASGAGGVCDRSHKKWLTDLASFGAPGLVSQMEPCLKPVGRHHTRWVRRDPRRGQRPNTGALEGDRRPSPRGGLHTIGCRHCYGRRRGHAVALDTPGPATQKHPCARQLPARHPDAPDAWNHADRWGRHASGRLAYREADSRWRRALIGGQWRPQSGPRQMHDVPLGISQREGTTTHFDTHPG